MDPFVAFEVVNTDYSEFTRENRGRVCCLEKRKADKKFGTYVHFTSAHSHTVLLLRLHFNCSGNS